VPPVPVHLFQQREQLAADGPDRAGGIELPVKVLFEKGAHLRAIGVG
jgi:hypothetical protein